MNFKEFYDRQNPKEIIEEAGLKLYVDMDGVLCDFEKGIHDIDGKTTLNDIVGKPDKIMWDLISKKGIYEFYHELEWHPEGKKLWNFIRDKHPTILSSLGRENPDRAEARGGKIDWLKEHDIDIPKLFTNEASDKKHFANSKAILIDDYAKNIKQWEEAGGIAIHFKTADEAIKKLKELEQTRKENIIVAPYVIKPDDTTMIDTEKQ